MYEKNLAENLNKLFFWSLSDIEYVGDDFYFYHLKKFWEKKKN